MGHDPLVVVRSFPNVFEARVAQSRLQAAGIPAFVPDANVLSIDPLLTDAIGGARLQVRSDHLEEATALLAQPPPDEDPRLGDDPTCPRCESPYWSTGWSNLQRVGLALTLGRGRRWWRQRSRCARCDLVFDEPTPAGGPSSYRLSDPSPPVPARRSGNPVFALRRRRTVAGTVVGLVVGMFSAMLLQTGPVAILLLAGLGWFIGHLLTYEVCSTPSCRAPLGPAARRCERCQGHVEGLVTSEAEHWIRKAAWHRAVPRESAPRLSKRRSS